MPIASKTGSWLTFLPKFEILCRLLFHLYNKTVRPNGTKMFGRTFFLRLNKFCMCLQYSNCCSWVVVSCYKVTPFFRSDFRPLSLRSITNLKKWIATIKEISVYPHYEAKDFEFFTWIIERKHFLNTIQMDDESDSRPNGTQTLW